MMSGIPVELASRFHLPPIEDYPFPELDYYQTFLIQTDYIVSKIAEAAYLGEKLDKDYTDVINARKFARAKVNELS